MDVHACELASAPAAPPIPGPPGEGRVWSLGDRPGEELSLVLTGHWPRLSTVSWEEETHPWAAPQALPWRQCGQGSGRIPSPEPWPTCGTGVVTIGPQRVVRVSAGLPGRHSAAPVPHPHTCPPCSCSCWQLPPCSPPFSGPGPQRWADLCWDPCFSAHLSNGTATWVGEGSWPRFAV